MKLHKKLIVWACVILAWLSVWFLVSVRKRRLGNEESLELDKKIRKNGAIAKALKKLIGKDKKARKMYSENIDSIFESLL